MAVLERRSQQVTSLHALFNWQGQDLVEEDLMLGVVWCLVAVAPLRPGEECWSKFYIHSNPRIVKNGMSNLQISVEDPKFET